MLVLTASNTYPGPTTIGGGTLQVGNGGTGASIGSTSGVIDNGALVFNNADSDVVFNPPISGSGGLTQTGTSTLFLCGANTYTGTTLVSNGTLLLGNAAALSGSTFDTSGAGVAQFRYALPPRPSADCRDPAICRSTTPARRPWP